MPPPTIDLSPFLGAGAGDPARQAVVDRAREACVGTGFFQVVGHGIDPHLRPRLEAVARRFFSLPIDTKGRIAMREGGRAWRGWFPVGGELTSGVPDDKEGLYFGTELGADHPAVRAGRPLHGPNLFPAEPAELAALVTRWMAAVTDVGQVLLRVMALGLGLEERWFDRWCADPVVLFRIFHYPPPPADLPAQWGVAEHTDYGLLTLLAQDDTGGLEVRTGDGWVEVPPTEGALVCNLGDMLERVSGGLYRSTPHRVALPDRDRISMALFLDPAWDAVVAPLPGHEPDTDRAAARSAGRWDDVSVFDGAAVYGDYLLAKVARVFPDLYREVMGS